MLALSCELIAGGYVGDVDVEGGIETKLDHFQLAQDRIPRAIPRRPLWPGFAINTIFCAAILWLLFATPGFIRRRRRIKRGLCPACAYPIGASETCTECGKPVHTDPTHLTSVTRPDRNPIADS
ncbi:MAG: hypothetical protein L0Y44_02760 [Phycisphaerales bacterium]|nr:hypothetical protein [Phycisphaerales bacterium]MCI0676865.1 hypothetical protein [Phycisphaerales bacterium]